MSYTAKDPKCSHCGLSECIYHEYKKVGPDDAPLSRSVDVCNLGMYPVPDNEMMVYGNQSTYGRCPFYVNGDNISKNAIMRKGIRNASYELIERIKTHPEEFIDYMGIHLNWFERFIMRRIEKRSIEVGHPNRIQYMKDKCIEEEKENGSK